MKIKDIHYSQYDKVCCVYKITNLVNDKVYIGSTNNFYMRCAVHKFCIKYPTDKHALSNPMYSELHNISIDNIDVEILELCIPDTRFERENFYTDLYKSDITGYNIRNGNTLSNSEIKKISRPVCQYTKSGLFVAEYPSQHEAERQTGIDWSSIRKCCKNRYKSAGGFVWKYK